MSMALPEIGMSVDVDVLDEIFERETPKCESLHRWRNDPPETCTHEVTHIYKTRHSRPRKVCEHTARALVENMAAGRLCALCKKLQSVCGWTVTPV